MKLKEQIESNMSVSRHIRLTQMTSCPPILIVSRLAQQLQVYISNLGSSNAGWHFIDNQSISSINNIA